MKSMQLKCWLRWTFITGLEAGSYIVGAKAISLTLHSISSTFLPLHVTCIVFIIDLNQCHQCRQEDLAGAWEFHFRKKNGPPWIDWTYYLWNTAALKCIPQDRARLFSQRQSYNWKVLCLHDCLKYRWLFTSSLCFQTNCTHSPITIRSFGNWCISNTRREPSFWKLVG